MNLNQDRSDKLGHLVSSFFDEQNAEFHDQVCRLIHFVTAPDKLDEYTPSQKTDLFSILEDLANSDDSNVIKAAIEGIGAYALFALHLPKRQNDALRVLRHLVKYTPYPQIRVQAAEWLQTLRSSK